MRTAEEGEKLALERSSAAARLEFAAAASVPVSPRGQAAAESGAFGNPANFSRLGEAAQRRAGGPHGGEKIAERGGNHWSWLFTRNLIALQWQ